MEKHVQISRLVFVLAALGFGACSDSNNSTGTSTPTSTALDVNAPAYSFVVVGCNRVDKADTAGDTSTANVQQLEHTFNDIAAMKPTPKFLFFAGDLTLGYTNDTLQLARELTAWRTLYEQSSLATSGVELVAVPGNHEVQNLSKIANVAAERTWLRVMAPYITRGGNGPQGGGPDGLTTDQSRLTYSFDYQDAHFITLNTDPTGDDWHVPSQWVAADVNAAKAAGAKHIFAIGHKPAYPYPTVATDGLSMDTTARNTFWAALLAGHAEAMFSAHNHVYYRTQPSVGKTWQVIAGNGGSPLEATLTTTIPSTGVYYGFSVVTVTNGGRVYVKSYGRDIPTVGYTAFAENEPTTVRDSIEITWQ